MTAKMEQRIFELNLPVHATSLYLLCCGLLDQGAKLTLQEIQSAWADTEETLSEAVSVLRDRNILSDGAENSFFVIPSAQWM